VSNRILACLGLALALGAAATAAPPADERFLLRMDLLASVNAERAAAGLPPLVSEPRLQRAAEAHAGDMLARRYYGHITPEGHGLAWRMVAAGYDYRCAAENVAKGVFDPDVVVRRWMVSRGHRGNILDPALVDVGIGIADGEEGGSPTTLWVLELGQPRDLTAAQRASPSPPSAGPQRTPPAQPAARSAAARAAPASSPRDADSP
jgi:hypothetical protein